MDKKQSFVKQLHDLEQSIFKEFALETSNNIHIEAVDLNNPLSSIYKILLSDIITSQMYSKSLSLPVIIPLIIFIKDQDSRKCAYLELNECGQKYLQSLFNDLTDFNKKRRINSFRKKVLNSDSTFYSNKNFYHYKLVDAETDKKIEERLKYKNPIEFNNKKYPKIREEEAINYAIKIICKIIGNTKKFNYETIDTFLTKISVLALHTKRNKRIFYEIEKQATKAAISQVMARNMSHNIGSHVLSKFKDENEICNVCMGWHNDTQYLASEKLNKTLSGNQLIAYFNEYLKNRMDFLADIATTDPVMETPMYLVRDILKGFDKNRTLLNRISGVSSSVKFAIKVLANNGKDEEQIEISTHSNDPLLSIPNEILGAQAFYILLENIIRNIYKHSNPNENKTIEITIHAKDYSEDSSFYQISIYDNTKKSRKIIEKIVSDRNKAFNDSVLDNNTLRSNNLGTIEMDVCAAYLRCLKIISIEDASFNLEKNNETKIPKLIYAYAHQHGENEFSLGYKICISKPKEILVVTYSSSDFKIKSCENDELIKKGIQVVSVDKLKEEEIYNHQILYSLVPQRVLKKILEKNNSKLPKRIVYKQKGVYTDSVEIFFNTIWGIYAIRNFYVNTNAYKLYNGTENEEYVKIYKKNKTSIESSNITDEKFDSIYIDDHNTAWEKQNKNKKWDYYDMACSHSKIAKLKGKIFKKETDISILSQYLEVINTTILLIDERLQQNIINEQKLYKGPGGITDFNEYFQGQKILIPTQKEANLNQVSFGRLSIEDYNDSESKSVSNNIYYFIKEHIGNAQFVVIHLGVLEKMLPSGQDKNVGDLNKLIITLFSNHRNKLVVTSGRGKPNNLPIDISFVPLALIQNAVETLYDKFLLTRILYNSRKSI